MKRVLLLSALAFYFAASVNAQSHTPATNAQATPPAAKAAASPAALNAARASFARLPLSFEENSGQTDSRVKYTSRGAGYNLFLTSDEAVFALRGGSTSANCAGPAEKIHANCADSAKKAGESFVLRLKMLGANSSARVAGTDALPGKINYYIGNNPAKWRTGVRQYGRVSYSGLYPGIDLTYYGNQQQLESDFIVAPGANPRSIEFEIKGARETRLDAQGNLVMVTSAGNVQLLRPVVYQMINGVRREVSGRYALRSGNRVGFSVGPYDRHEQLIIDPTLVYATYLGGSSLSGGDNAQAIAIDAAGNAYVAGQGTSSDFPGSDLSGPPVSQLSDFAFVTVFSSTGSPASSSAPGQLVYSTILSGSSGLTVGNGIGVDGSGNAYIAGSTSATDFPMVNPFQATYGDPIQSGFLAGLTNASSSTPGALIYSTYFGGRNTNDTSELQGLYADSTGNAYVVGDTTSPNFPTFNSYQSTLNGTQNVVVAKFNNQGQAQYSTYLGGNSYDYGTAITADGSGNAYVTGYTSSSSFPVQTSPAPFQNALAGSENVFISKLAFSGSTLTLPNSTYVGGNSTDQAMGIAVDSATPPNVYVTGETTSTTFPTTASALSITNGGGTDAFVTKVKGDFTALTYSTYLGGTGTDIGYAIGLDGSNNAYVTGSTTSSNFPTKLPLQSTIGAVSATNAFLAELNTTGTALNYSTYLGGTGTDAAYGIAVDSTGNAYIAGKTTSANFPVMSGGGTGTTPFQGQLGDSAGNAFAAKISPTAATAALNFFPPSYNFHNAGIGASSVETVTLSNNTSASATVNSLVFGGANSGDFTLKSATAPCLTSGSFTLAAGASCTITIQFAPTDQDGRVATLTATYNGSSTSVMNLSGNGGAPEASLSTTSINFGTVLLNVQGTSGITVTNTGGGPLQLGSAQITPSGASPFTVSTSSSSCFTTPIAPGSSCTIGLLFVPTTGTTTGTTFNATLLINSNAAGSPASVSLTGIGKQAVIVSPTSLELGIQIVNSTSTENQNEAFLQNGSGETINVTVTPGTGADQGDFHLSSINGVNACSTVGALAPGGTCYLVVYFQPQAASATDGRTGSYTIGWTGTSIATVVPGLQIVNVMGTGITGISLYTNSITGPNEYVGFTESSAGLEYLANGTPNPITVTTALSGNNPGDFTAALDSTCAPGGVVPANTYCRVDLSFTPSALGLRTATVTFNYAGVSNGQLTLSLSGTGIPGPVFITSNSSGFAQQITSFDFGSEIISTTTPEKVFQLRNAATSPLTVQPIAAPGNTDFKFTRDSTCPVAPASSAITVPGGGSCFIGMTFTPTSTGTKETTSIVITDAYTSTNGTDAASPHTLTLNGTGELAAITVSVTSGAANLLDFGNVQLNPSPVPQAAIYLANAGNTSTTISWSGGSPALNTAGTAFGLVTSGANVTTCTQGKVVLPQGGNCLIGITFAPATAGLQTNSVTFSDSLGGSHTVNIQGTAVGQGKLSLSTTTTTTFQQFTFTQLEGTTSSAQTVTVANLGSGPMTITSLPAFGTNISNFTILPSSTCAVGTVIPSGSSGNTCVFNVTFTAPATPGSSTEDLEVFASLGNNATGSALVQLSGTSVSGGFLLSPAGPIAFGPVAVGSTVTSAFYSLTNENATSVTFGTMTVPAGPAGYTISSDSCSGQVVTASSECFFEISFAPTSAASFNGNLSLPFTGATGSPYTVAITGSGSAAVVANPNPLNFQAFAGSTSFQSVTIGNGSASAATITSVSSFTGAGAADYSFNFNGCFSGGVGVVLPAAGGTCTIDINFLSPTAGTFTGQFTVSYSIGGIAQTPITVTLNATIPASLVTATPNPLVFSSQTVNTQSQIMSVTLTNNASATQTLNVSTLQISGNDFAIFSPGSGNCFNVAAGATCTIPIAFTPSAAGARTGTLTITDNSTTSPHVITLNGTGIAGSVTATPNPLPFPSTNVGSSVTLGANLSNTTGSPITISNIVFTGPYALDKGSNGCSIGQTVSAVTGACVVYIKFTPTGATNTGTATITYGSGSTIVINLSGTGVNPVVSVSPLSLTFGAQLVGTQSAAQPVTLTNGTSASISITSTPFTGDFLAGSNTCTGTVLAGANCVVNVAFKPTATGTRTGTLTISESGTSFPVTLSGTGTAPATIAVNSGNSQSVVVNTAFAALVATVKDSGGNTLPGVSVTFTVTTGSSGAGATFAGNLSSATVTTDSSGNATSPTLTANDIPGTFSVGALAGSVGPATFSLTNTQGTPASITATAGTPQSVAVGTAFATALQATVLDSHSLPLDGITVTFTAPSTGASGTFTGGTNGGLTATAVTNSSGVATAPAFTANGTSGGPYNVAATAGAVGPANFALTNLTGPPSSVTATAGTPQSVAIGTLFGTNLQVTVKDNKGNLLSGVTVTFTAPTTGASGTFAGGTSGGTVVTATTNGSGVATAAAFTANSVVGSYTVNATVSGVSTPAAFSLSNVAGPPASITATAGTPQSAAVTAAFTTNLQATVKDSGGNPVSGATVTFTAPSTGASGTFAGGSSGGTVVTATTNASGVATAAVFTANSTIGSYTVNASVTGVVTQAAFSLSNVAGPPASIAVSAGNSQSATISTAFATNLAVTVKDAGGNLVSGATVTFTAPSTGASGAFAGGTSGGTIVTATTSASGVAAAPAFTANTVAGSYTVNATVTGVSSPAAFSLTNVAGAPATIAASSGASQSVVISTAFATMQATVKDASGNLVSGASVTFTVTAATNGASGTFTGGLSAATVTTNASGVASAPTFTANTIAGGPYTVKATSGSATSASFSLTNLAGPAANVAVSAGNSQSATISTAFATNLAAVVKDASGNPVNGVTVTFTAPSTGASGTFAGGTSGGTVATGTTNASGVATAPVFTANKTAGPYTVNATVSGVANPAAFSLTNNVGAASAISATSGASQSVAINTAFASLQATVTDSGGNGVSGVSVTFAVTAASNGASGTFTGGVTTATVTTDANGVATAPTFTSNSTAGGPYTVAAKAGTIGPANFSLTNLSAPPASIAATAGSGQSAPISTAFTTNLQATVQDKNNLPISGVTVTFTAPSSGASGTFTGGTNGGLTATAITNSSGVATAPVFTANSIAGGPYNVQATAGTVSVNFSMTNQTGPAAAVTVSAGGTQSVAVNTAFATLQAIVKDSGGNPVSGATVTFTAPATGASGTFAGGTSGGTIVTATTGSNGVASASTFTANSVAGSYTVTAAVSGVTAKASFSLTNLPGPAAKLLVSGGASQSVAVNTAFAALAVTVTDASGNGVSGVSVTFTAPSSGASGTFAGGGTTATVTTVATGVATAPTFTSNNTVGGPYSVAASATGLTTVDFSLTNLAGTPASIVTTAGTPQSVAISTVFPTALVATVKDNKSNPLSGVVVTFTAPSSGPSGTFAGGTNGGIMVTATTDSNGNATAPAFTANSTAGGPYNVAAAAGTLAPVNFSLTNLAGAPASISATAGTPQSAVIDKAFSTALQATVKDSGGNLLSGVIVTFTAPSTGASGTFAGGTSNGNVVTATTNASGVATAAAFTANSTVGTYTVNASVGGLSAAFSLTNQAGPPASIAATAGTPQTVTISTIFPTALSATVKDSGGNPVSGATVTFTAPSTGASGTFTGGTNNGTTVTATTGANGVATAALFTANGTAGTYTVNATVTGVSTPAAFTLTNQAGPPASIAATAGTPQSAPVTTAFATALQATVKDSGGNLVSGASVTFTSPASGASGTFTGGTNGGTTITVTTNASGVATAPVFTANAAGGSYNVTAAVTGVSATAAFALTNTVAPDVSITLTHSGDFTVNSSGVYTIKATNNGTGPTTGNIVVTDALPAGLSFVSNTGTGWACAAGAQNAQIVTCTYTGAALAASGGNSTFTLIASVAPGAFPSVTNAATVADPNDSKSSDKSATDAATNIDNVVPTQTSFSPNFGLIAGATTAQQITITGTGFNSSTTVTLGTAAPLNTPLTGTANAAGTSLVISIPPAELVLANAGNLTITVTNPKNPTTGNGGGPATSTQTLPLVGMSSIAPQSGTPTPVPVVAGTPYALQMNLNLTPSGATLPADVTITCSFPASLTGATCSPSPSTIAHGTISASTVITINAVPGGAAAAAAPSLPGIGGHVPWSTSSLWLIAAVLLSMLGMLGAFKQRVAQFRRAPMYLTLALLMLAAGALVGCTKAAPSGPTPTPTGPSTITVTATTADGATVSATVNITISN